MYKWNNYIMHLPIHSCPGWLFCYLLNFLLLKMLTPNKNEKSLIEPHYKSLVLNQADSTSLPKLVWFFFFLSGYFFFQNLKFVVLNHIFDMYQTCCINIAHLSNQKIWRILHLMLVSPPSKVKTYRVHLHEDKSLLLVPSTIFQRTLM